MYFIIIIANKTVYRCRQIIKTMLYINTIVRYNFFSVHLQFISNNLSFVVK